MSIQISQNIIRFDLGSYGGAQMEFLSSGPCWLSAVLISATIDVHIFSSKTLQFQSWRNVYRYLQQRTACKKESLGLLTITVHFFCIKMVICFWSFLMMMTLDQCFWWQEIQKLLFSTVSLVVSLLKTGSLYSFVTIRKQCNREDLIMGLWLCLEAALGYQKYGI